jgi:hypothetical protein
LSTKEIIKGQYYAALEMLRQAIVKCLEALWSDPAYANPFWHVAYHTLFYTHLYLQPSEADFVPWEQHLEGRHSLGRQALDAAPEGEAPYSREEILAYHELCRQQVEAQVAALDLEGPSGFYWLPFNKLALQFYNIRHIQQHTGELCERLGWKGEIEVEWVGTKPE